MQLLGNGGLSEQREFVALYRDSLHQPLPSFIEVAPTGIGRDLRLSVNAFWRNFQNAFLSSVPTKILQDQIMKKRKEEITQDLFQIPFHSLKSPKDYIQLDKFYEALQSGVR